MPTVTAIRWLVKAGREPFIDVRHCRGGGDSRGDNGGDMTKEAAEQRRDQQPQPGRLSAEQDHRRGEAALNQQCRQENDERDTAFDNSAGDDAGGRGKPGNAKNQAGRQRPEMQNILERIVTLFQPAAAPDRSSFDSD
jgi:hypothetical protein